MSGGETIRVEVIPVGGGSPPRPDGASLALPIPRDVALRPNQAREVPMGVAVRIPAGHVGLCASAPSVAASLGVAVAGGVMAVAPGDDQELVVTLVNRGDRVAVVAAGTEVAALIVLPSPAIEAVVVGGQAPRG